MGDKIYNFYDGAQNVEHIDTQIININSGSKSGNPEVSDDPIVADLLPIFGNNRTEVEAFLNAIKGVEQRQITRLVKQLVKRNVILEEMKNKPLYDVLNKHNIYICCIQNWNQQLI